MRRQHRFIRTQIDLLRYTRDPGIRTRTPIPELDCNIASGRVGVLSLSGRVGVLSLSGRVGVLSLSVPFDPLSMIVSRVQRLHLMWNWSTCR